MVVAAEAGGRWCSRKAAPPGRACEGEGGWFEQRRSFRHEGESSRPAESFGHAVLIMSSSTLDHMPTVFGTHASPNVPLLSLN